MKALLICGFLFLSACAHSIHEVHTSDFMPGVAYEMGTPVRAEATQFTFMGFTSETNYVENAYRKLQEACPTGAISGITTQYSTDLGFFSWTNKILMQGLCIRVKTASR